MLPAAHRLSDAELFRSASRRGRRASSTTVVTHLLTPDPISDGPSQVGFVVSKAVGNAVHRNRVQRRLRHLMRDRVGRLPGGAVLVVRAKPAADTATFAALGADVDRCLGRVTAPEGQGAS